jgi:hypothetical protein
MVLSPETAPPVTTPLNAITHCLSDDLGKRWENGRTRGCESDPIEETRVANMLSAGTAPIRPVYYGGRQLANGSILVKEKKRTSGTKNSTTGIRSIVPQSKGKHCPSAYTHNDTLFPFVCPVPVPIPHQHQKQGKRRHEHYRCGAYTSWLDCEGGVGLEDEDGFECCLFHVCCVWVVGSGEDVG